jgi:hypothetical protein
MVGDEKFPGVNNSPMLVRPQPARPVAFRSLHSLLFVGLYQLMLYSFF